MRAGPVDEPPRPARRLWQRAGHAATAAPGSTGLAAARRCGPGCASYAVTTGTCSRPRPARPAGAPRPAGGCSRPSTPRSAAPLPRRGAAPGARAAWSPTGWVVDADARRAAGPASGPTRRPPVGARRPTRLCAATRSTRACAAAGLRRRRREPRRGDARWSPLGEPRRRVSDRLVRDDVPHLCRGAPRRCGRPVRRARPHRLPALRRRPPRRARPPPGHGAVDQLERRSPARRRTPCGPGLLDAGAGLGGPRRRTSCVDGRRPRHLVGDGHGRAVDRRPSEVSPCTRLAAPPALRLRLGLSRRPASPPLAVELALDRPQVLAGAGVAVGPPAGRSPPRWSSVSVLASSASWRPQKSQVFTPDSEEPGTTAGDPAPDMAEPAVRTCRTAAPRDTRDQVEAVFLRWRGRGRDAPAARPARPCGSTDGPPPAGGHDAAAAPLPGARTSARAPGLRS